MDYEKLKGIVDFNAIAVDAGCSGNPGAMEYQGVYLGNEVRYWARTTSASSLPSSMHSPSSRRTVGR